MERRKRRRLNQADHDHNEGESVPDAPVRKQVNGQKLLRNITNQKLHGRRDGITVGNEDEHQKVLDLLGKTVKAGESNSMLLIGPRGSGKSRAVSDAVRELSTETSDSFHVVRLNPLIQRDDKLALREIMRQLGKQMAEDDDAEEETKNYSDTLTKLIAMLSSRQSTEGVNPAQIDSLEVARSVIFVLEEFDQFALHPRQTLLYNLFDIAQSSSRSTPIAVLGLTTQVNVMEMLEKRVKSRFSHRYVLFKPPDTFPDFQKRCLSALLLTSDELSEEESNYLEKHSNISDELQVWNETMMSLLKLESTTRNMKYEYYASKCVPNALVTLSAAILSMLPGDDGKLVVTGDTIHQHDLWQAPDNKLHLLSQLPQFALSMLICAARLELVHCSDLVNFNMAYDEYHTMISRSKTSSSSLNTGASTGRAWSSGLAFNMWNHLVECELMLPLTGSAGAKRHVERAEMCRIDVALEEIRDHVSGLDPSLKDWCKI